MSRLNDIAVAIKNVYQPGALVNIASDGILFNGEFDIGPPGETSLLTHHRHHRC